MAKKLTSVVTDQRYLDFQERYYADWSMACAELFVKYPSWQQEDILDDISQPNARTSVSSGHGTGKSDLASMIIMLFLMLHPSGRIVIVANKIKQVKDVIWKYMKINYATLQKEAPWLAQYFVITETEFYERTCKGVWFVTPKGFRLNQESSLAGEHADHMLTIIDEACGVNDKAFGVLMGAQTGLDNRVMCLSQPLIQGGFFYNTHHSMSNLHGGDWTSIVLNSMESPWVTVRWIKEHLIMYGGYDSPEFQIKVLGRFPKHMSDMLLGRDDCQQAVNVDVQLEDDWGWVATCDVGNGRDRSVINISKVSGEIGANRRVKNHKVLEMKADLKPIAFARRIFAECTSGAYPNITIAVDGDGIGTSVIEALETLLVDSNSTVQSIRWGLPCFSKSQRKRFYNRRAMAHIYTKEAILDGRMSLDPHPKTLDQGSKLPAALNDQGQWLMMKKLVMKSKHQIDSPDRFDTYCFTQLVSYVPRNETTFAEYDDVEGELEDFLD